MATQPTNLPVPSESARDLKFNAGKIDEFVTSLAVKYKDRFGGEHHTIEGLRQLAQQAIAVYGWVPMDSFQAGATLTLPNQVLRWKLPDGDGDYYRWDGAFPKTVPTASTPASTGGVGAGAWLSVGDAVLRTELSSDAGAGMIGTESGKTVQHTINFNAYGNQIMSSFSEFGGQLSALKSDLSNPLTQFVGVVLVGDSITWGMSATGIATTDPRSHQLTDARNNSTSNSWANLFHKYIGKRFRFNPTYTESGWPGSPTGVCVFKYSDVINTYPGYSPVELSGSWADNQRSGALLNRTIDTTSVGDSFSFVFTGYEFDIVFSSTESTGTLVVSSNGVDISSINTNSSATGGVNFQVRRTITLASFSRNAIISVKLASGAGARIEAISVTKTTRITNQGLIGIAASEYNSIFSSALTDGDIYCFITLGTNDRAGTSNARSPNALQINTNGFASFLRARNVNPIICSANQVTGPQLTESFYYQMQSVSAALREASKRNVCDFVDYLPVTTLANERFSYTVSDGLHPNDSGHYLMYINLVTALENSALTVGDRMIKVMKSYAAPAGQSSITMKAPLLSTKSAFGTIDLRINGGDWYYGGSSNAVAINGSITASMSRAFVKTNADNILLNITNGNSTTSNIDIEIRIREIVYCL